MRFRFSKHFPMAALLLALVACNNDGNTTSSNNVAAPPAQTGPATLAASTTLEDGVTMGVANSSWAGASSAHGQTAGGLNCGAPGPNYTYTHLNIYRNGTLLTLPRDIGVVPPSATQLQGCVYPAHTRDRSGKIRFDANVLVTLGQFFAVWGQPLSSTNVAGLTQQPIKIYINDGGTLLEYTGDPAALQLLPQREITIVAGSGLSQIPTYMWMNPPPLSNSPIALADFSSIGTPYWPDGDTGTGGQGATVNGVKCELQMSAAYHVHAHVAIVRNGQMLAIPKNIGITGSCFYELHTHDATGVAHIEPTVFRKLTLGNLFSVWGEPLSNTNVAGITGEPIAIYINEGGDAWQYHGDPRDIQLQSHRSITIQVGSAMSQIPTYDWGPLVQ